MRETAGRFSSVCSPQPHCGFVSPSRSNLEVSFPDIPQAAVRHASLCVSSPVLGVAQAARILQPEIISAGIRFEGGPTSYYAFLHSLIQVLPFPRVSAQIIPLEAFSVGITVAWSRLELRVIFKKIVSLETTWNKFHLEQALWQH